MNNETFGMTFQYAICIEYDIKNKISIERIDKELLATFLKSKIIRKIFRRKSKPIKSLYKTREFTSEFISRCPHSFLLENEETFGIQFHPEVYHSTDGLQLLRNFIVEVCH